MKGLPALLVAAVLAPALVLFVGCSGQSALSDGSAGSPVEHLEKTIAYDNEAKIGMLSIEYPDDFAIVREYDAGVNQANLPDGTNDMGSVQLASETVNASFMIASADDPDKYGFASVEKMLSEVPEKLKAMEESSPQMYEAMKDNVWDAPQRVTVNGAEALRCVLTTKSMMMVFYYFEIDGSLVGYVSGAFPIDDYDKNPDYYDSIIATTVVA